MAGGTAKSGMYRATDNGRAKTASLSVVSPAHVDPVRGAHQVRVQAQAGRGPQIKGNAVSKRILVVDDRENLLTLLRMLLEDEQYQVSVLKEGRGAVDHIRDNPPDLIILDLKLADASGMDILETLRGQSTTADIPVI